MYKIVFSAVMALGLAGAAITNAPAAQAADVGISFNFGDVAFAYSDGYWDNSHQWHKWRNTKHREQYRQANAGNYNGWKHTRDKDKGWHDRDHDGRNDATQNNDRHDNDRRDNDGRR